MTTTPPDMAAALARMWAKFLPEMQTRIALIEEAARALADGSLGNDLREAAHAAAHKLAGSLGLFGLTQGTEIARAMEVAFEAGNAPSAAEVAVQAAELRQMIESRG